MMNSHLHLPLTLLFTSLVVSACGGGGSGESAIPDNSPPTLQAVSPANGANNVARSLPVTASFNEDLFSVSVDSTSVVLSHELGTVPSEIQLNASTITLQPNSSLGNLTRYEAMVTSSISDLAGNHLDQNYSWSFTTEDGNWKDAILIESSIGNISAAQTAYDNNGNAMTVWQQNNGLIADIWFNRYSESSGWGTAERIELDSGTAQNPQIAADSNGNAIVVWQQDNGSQTNIWAKRYVAEKGWEDAQLIDSEEGDAANPQISADDNGNALVVWSQSDLSRHNIWANHYDPTEGWGTATLIESNNDGAARSPQVTTDNNGNGVAIWAQWSNALLSFTIWANSYSKSHGWGAAERIDQESETGFTPQVEMDGQGNALAVWSQSDGTQTNIWANQFSTQAGWSTATLIESDDAGNASAPQIATNSAGSALSVWAQSDGERTNIWSNHYNLQQGWGTAVLIESDNVGSAYAPQVTIDNNGNALAIWSQSDGSAENIVTRRYLMEGGWSTTTVIETFNLNATRPQISSNNKGNAIAIWQQYDGTYNSAVTNQFN